MPLALLLSPDDQAVSAITAVLEEMLVTWERPLDGVSLTINEVAGSRFGVNVIPHTWESTNLAARAPGDRVNLEVDVIAKYVERLMDERQ